MTPLNIAYFLSVATFSYDAAMVIRFIHLVDYKTAVYNFFQK